MEEVPLESRTEITPLKDVAKTWSESIKTINRKKIKIKQAPSDWKLSSKKCMSAAQDRAFHTERRFTNEDGDDCMSEQGTVWPKKEWDNWTVNEEFIVLLQKEIKRLQNITNDLSYQLIMNGHTPQIKESERVPIDLSINPLRRREQKSRLADTKIIPSKLMNKSHTNDFCENYSNTSTQADVVVRPNSGFRIREQHNSGKSQANEVHPLTERPELQTEKGPSKVDKYNKEKDFVKKIEKETIKKISNIKIDYKPSIKKDNIAFKKGGKTSKQNLVLPPLEAKDENK